MNKYSDRDTPDDEEENMTQVRSIIRQLNEEQPSQEKKREVIVRPDGSKVVRVTKRRRKMVTSREKQNRSRKSFLISISGIFLLLCIIAAFFFYRMAGMTGEDYIQSRVADVQRAWGAEQVRIVGEGIMGTTFHVDSIVAEFPEESLIESVEMSGIEAELVAGAFFNNLIRADKVTIKRAVVRLRGEATAFRMPRMQGEAPWMFDRMECEDFSVSWGEKESAPVALSNCAAYLYYPRSGRDNCVLVLKSGQFRLQNWQPIRIMEAKMHLSPAAVEDMSLRGTVDAESAGSESSRTSIMFRGRLGEGDSLSGPYRMQALNMPFADFTGGRFEEFLSARTGNVLRKEMGAAMTIAPDGPQFSGEFELNKIIITSFPAITTMLEHIEPLKRRAYLPPTVTQGYVTLQADGGAMTLTLPENKVVEPYKFAVRGEVTVNAANELSGELRYGMPGLLTRAEYSDGISDPLFQDQGDWAWLSTSLRGFANRPGDNIDELEKAAAEQRKSRPERFHFDAIDINKMSEAIRKDMETKPEDVLDKSERPSLDDVGKDPFEDTPEKGDNPFAPLTPF